MLVPSLKPIRLNLHNMLKYGAPGGDIRFNMDSLHLGNLNPSLVSFQLDVLFGNY